MTDIFEKRIAGLKRRLRSLESAVVAFSGGVDSTLLLECARLALGDRAIAATASSPSYMENELEDARRFCEERGIRQVVIETDEMDDPNYASNPHDRCYFCKRNLLKHLMRVADENGIGFVLEGTNASELEGHRPGRRAIEECERVVAPLADEGLSKEDVREMARGLGLPVWDRPSAACLSSRVPSGMRITSELLRRIGAAEEVVRRTGARQVRVRHHGETARIEVDPSDMVAVFERRGEIVAELQALGWRFISLDLAGYRTGSISG